MAHDFSLRSCEQPDGTGDGVVISGEVGVLVGDNTPHAGAHCDRRSYSGTVPGPSRRRFVEDFVELLPLLRTRPEVELPFRGQN